MAKKKGTLYTDDPGCKYVVVEDPWPGNAKGSNRKDLYYNYLGAWVYYMLGKTAGPEYIYSMNTVCCQQWGAPLIMLTTYAIV